MITNLNRLENTMVTPQYLLGILLLILRLYVCAMIHY